MKRVVDVVVGGAISVVALPVVVGLALVGAFVWQANPFFVQERIGRDGRTFRLYKLRSLPPSAPAYADKYEIDGVDVHPFGRWLRRTHMDELPQLSHVVAGRMSLVGPRPEMPFLHERMPESFARERTRIRPGITGLWQISAAVRGLICEAPGYDRLYLRASTLRLDLWIIWRTLLKLVGTAPIPAPHVPVWTRPVPSLVQRAAAADRRGAVAADGGSIIDLTAGSDRVILLPELEGRRSGESGMTREPQSSTLISRGA